MSLPISTVESAAYQLRQMELYLDFLRLANDYVEEKLEKKYSPEDLDKVINADEFSPEEEEYSKYLDMFSSLYGDFPRRLYSSFIISWYSFIEGALGEVCDYLLLNQRRLYVARNRGVLLAREVFRNSEIQFTSNHEEELNWVTEIRNNIVHNGGVFPIFHEKPKENPIVGPFRYTDENSIERNYYLKMDRNFHNYLQEKMSLEFISPPSYYQRLNIVITWLNLGVIYWMIFLKKCTG